MIRRTQRRFSKQMIVINCALAWGAIFFAIYSNQSQWITVSAFGLIAAINAYYMKVGHDDLSKILTTVAGGKQQDSDNPQSSGPAMPEPEEH